MEINQNPINPQGVSGFVKIGVIIGCAVALIMVLAYAIGVRNQAVNYEIDLIARYKDNQNVYDSTTKKVIETFRVSQAYSKAVSDAVRGALIARNGEDGSRAVFLAIREQNPQISEKMYLKVQQLIEAGRTEFQASQTTLLDEGKAYQKLLGSFMGGTVASIWGFPRMKNPTLDEVLTPVTSNSTQQAFDTKKAEALEFK